MILALAAKPLAMIDMLETAVTLGLFHCKKWQGEPEDHLSNPPPPPPPPPISK